ncbi:hypothetical protein ECC02_009947 [Trypanosoma cruzi]|uniref:Uncharacterized protein n=1 Tax=Trypanosoma cruzi TaxID=5693 RepID=A0A7J6XRR7_TRYCR|nr:hypothetical protein ECC02_009947 [Trypanosoma cruzi]
MRYGPNPNNHARWQHTPIQTKEKHGGRVWLCVWRCGCLPALAAKKQNKRERNVCSAPQALVARPHVTAPSARRSSRPLLMRAAGEAHRAVVMSVSVGVRVEQLGGKHTAPLAGRVQKKQLKEGRVEKKKNVHSGCPKSKRKKKWGMRDESKKTEKIKKFKPLKNEKNSQRPAASKKKKRTLSKKKKIKNLKTHTKKELQQMAPPCMHPHAEMCPRKQLRACIAYECV